MTTDLDVAGEDVWEVVHDLDLPLLLVELEHYTVTAATPSLFRDLGLRSAKVLGKPIFDLFDDRDHERSMLALQAITNGLVEFYRTHRRLRTSDGTGLEVSAWVRALDFGERRLALAEYSTNLTPRNSPLVEHLGYSPPLMALGTTDAVGTILSVSDTVRAIVGIEPARLVGTPLLNDDEQRRLCLQLDQSAGEQDFTASISLNFRDLVSGRGSVRCIITSLADSTSRWFMLLSGPDPATAPKFDRVAQLEHRLWRIASEVQASGIFDSLGSFPDAQRFPQLNSLTTRQWEVLSRLLRGERVPSIAAALYVSQSTVRNNLSDIFRVFGVHSQAELLELLH
jgi:DNA-binding CsgD family transcriptional regulator/PAS domain-containing protein